MKESGRHSDATIGPLVPVSGPRPRPSRRERALEATQTLGRPSPSDSPRPPGAPRGPRAAVPLSLWMTGVPMARARQSRRDPAPRPEAPEPSGALWSGFRDAWRDPEQAGPLLFRCERPLGTLLTSYLDLCVRVCVRVKKTPWPIWESTSTGGREPKYSLWVRLQPRNWRSPSTGSGEVAERVKSWLISSIEMFNPFLFSSNRRDFAPLLTQFLCLSVRRQPRPVCLAGSGGRSVEARGNHAGLWRRSLTLNHREEILNVRRINEDFISV